MSVMIANPMSIIRGTHTARAEARNLECCIISTLRTLTDNRHADETGRDGKSSLPADRRARISYLQTHVRIISSSSPSPSLRPLPHQPLHPHLPRGL